MNPPTNGTPSKNQRAELTRALALVTSATCLILAFGFFAWYRMDPARVLTARELHIVDDGGRVRLRLAAVDDQPGVALLDQRGKLRALFVMTLDDQPALTFFDDQRRMRATLGIARQGAPILSLDDAEGKPRARLDTLAGEPTLTLFHGDRSQRAPLAMTRSGLPELRLYEDNKKVTLSTRRRNSQ